MKEGQQYSSPWSRSCDVICPWKQEAIVLSRFARGQVVPDAHHHNVDIVKRSPTAGLLHVATDADVDLKRRRGYVI